MIEAKRTTIGKNRLRQRQQLSQVFHHEQSLLAQVAGVRARAVRVFQLQGGQQRSHADDGGAVRGGCKQAIKTVVPVAGRFEEEIRVAEADSRADQLRIVFRL